MAASIFYSKSRELFCSSGYIYFLIKKYFKYILFTCLLIYYLIINFQNIKKKLPLILSYNNN